MEALKGQHRNLDLAVRGLQDQRRQLAEIQAHNARKFRRARRAPRLTTLPLIQMRVIQRVTLPLRMHCAAGQRGAHAARPCAPRAARLRLVRRPPARASGGAAVRAHGRRGAGQLHALHRDAWGRSGGGPGPRAEGARRPAAWARRG